MSPTVFSCDGSETKTRATRRLMPYNWRQIFRNSLVIIRTSTIVDKHIITVNKRTDSLEVRNFHLNNNKYIVLFVYVFTTASYIGSNRL